MLEMALPPVEVGRDRAKRVRGEPSVTMMLETEVEGEESMELIPERDGDALREAKHEHGLSGEGVVVTAEFGEEADADGVVPTTRWLSESENESDDEDDSDYTVEEDDHSSLSSSVGSSDEDGEEVDVDDHVGRVGEDFYLTRMLQNRERMEDADAAWVERYITAQREWKATHGTSIDETDLDLRLAGLLEGSRPPVATPSKWWDSATPSGVKEVWQTTVAPLLPRSLGTQPVEWLLPMAAVALFVALAISIQLYVALQAPRYT